MSQQILNLSCWLWRNWTFKTCFFACWKNSSTATFDEVKHLRICKSYWAKKTGVPTVFFVLNFDLLNLQYSSTTLLLHIYPNRSFLHCSQLAGNTTTPMYVEFHGLVNILIIIHWMICITPTFINTACLNVLELWLAFHTSNVAC